eukprot:2329724-Alexandrium_andersonii.AAC.1
MSSESRRAAATSDSKQMRGPLCTVRCNIGGGQAKPAPGGPRFPFPRRTPGACLLYTSDAADDM